MVRVAVGIVCYQDKPGLLRLIKSIYDNIDVIIVIDGRYNDWGTEDMPMFSTDGTKEMCESLPKVKLHFIHGPQIEKRTKYLSLCEEYECDFLVVLDADEFVHPSLTDWKLFRNYIEEHIPLFEEYYNMKPRRQILNIQFIHTPEQESAFAGTEPPQWAFTPPPGKRIRLDPKTVRSINLGRVLYKPWKMFYYDHWRLKDVDNPIITIPYPRNTRFSFIPGLVITSDDLTRPKSRLASDIDYQFDLFLKEGFITEQQHNSLDEKKKFEESILNEVYIWEKYYEQTKDKIREVDEDWLLYYINKEKEFKRQ